MQHTHTHTSVEEPSRGARSTISGTIKVPANVHPSGSMDDRPPCGEHGTTKVSRAGKGDGRRYPMFASFNVRGGNADYRMKEPRSVTNVDVNKWAIRASAGVWLDELRKGYVCKCFQNVAATKVRMRSTCNTFS